MQNIMLHISYEGTNFSGYQEQEGRRTVAGVMREAVETLTGRTTRLIAAGRTDAGVHAECQVLNFLTTLSMPASAFVPQLNLHLPEDVRVLRAVSMASNFHARFYPHITTYRYQVWNGENCPPTLRRSWFHFSYALDLQQMRQAGALFLGRHNFSAFSIAEPFRNPVREIRAIKIDQGDPFFSPYGSHPIIFQIQGTSFLHQQVRRMVGALLSVGRGKMTRDQISVLLEGKLSSPDVFAAEAKGLVLQKICYMENNL